MTQKSSAGRFFARPARWLSLLSGLSLLTASPIAPAGSVPSALPGGRTTFVVATAKLHDGTAYDNWTQLGWYRFDGAKRQVRAETFVWRQDAPVEELRRERAGVLPDTGCSGRTGQQVNRCQVMTAPGYSAKASSRPPEERIGGYSLRADGDTVYLDIRWPRGVTETWSVHSMPGLARLDWVKSNNATAGYAYGSNAPISERREMATVHEHPELPYVSTSWEKNEAKDEVWHQPGLKPAEYDHCDSTSSCMTRFQEKSDTSCKCGRDRPMTSVQYYLARVSSKDRRDTWWHWCTCLVADDRDCYKGNSHVKPLLQIIDDDHKFRGYVGAEASFYPYVPRGEDPRMHDMLGVFRFAHPAPAPTAVRTHVR